MKYIASCSGGKDSIATLLLAQEHNEPLDEVVYCEVMFNDQISGEHPLHRDFIYEKLKPFVENKLGVPFVVLRDERTYTSLFHTRISRGQHKGLCRGFAIPGLCCVNRDCKIPPIRRYWKQYTEDVTQYVGIAIDEPKRLARLEGTNQVSLLAKYNYTEDMAKQLCIANDLLSPIYDLTNRNGCWFCFNNPDRQWVDLLTNYPELFAELEQLDKSVDESEKYRKCLTRTETVSELKERLLN